MKLNILFILSTIFFTNIFCLDFQHLDNTTSNVMTDRFDEFPVEYRSNLPFVGSEADIHKHVHDVLSPLMPYIRNNKEKLQSIRSKRTAVNGQFVSQADQLLGGGGLTSTVLNDASASEQGLNFDSFNAGSFNGGSFNGGSVGGGTANAGSSSHGVLTTNTFTANGEVIQLYEYKYDIVAAAQIGPYTFT